MKYYDNGEKIIKDRMEDEDWYSDYQTMITFAIGIWPMEIDVLLKEYESFYEGMKNRMPKKKTRLRWATMLIERLSNRQNKV